MQVSRSYAAVSGFRFQVPGFLSFGTIGEPCRFQASEEAVSSFMFQVSSVLSLRNDRRAVQVSYPYGTIGRAVQVSYPYGTIGRAVQVSYPFGNDLLRCASVLSLRNDRLRCAGFKFQVPGFRFLIPSGTICFAVQVPRLLRR